MTEEWQEARLGDVLSLEYGKSLPERVRTGNGSPVFGSNGVVGYHDEPLVAGPGIIVGRKGTAGSVTWSDEDFFPIDTTYWVKIGDPQRLDIRYAALVLESLNLPAVTAQTGVPGLNRERAYDLTLPLPPLAVQWRIVDLMEHLDNQVNRLRTEAEALRVLEERARDSLTAPDPDWREYRLGEMCIKIGSGATPRGGEAAYKAEGVALIRSQNVHDGRFVWEGLAHIDDEQAAGLANVTVQSGDCLTNITGASVNRTCVVPSKALPARVNQHVAILRGDPSRTSGAFINQLLRRSETRSYLDRLALAGTTRQAITKQQLAELSLWFPPLGAQEEVVATLAAFESQHASLERESRQLIALRGQALAALLSGLAQIPGGYDELLGVAS